jgi:hypothetical protein
MAFNPGTFVDPSQFGDYSYYSGLAPDAKLGSFTEEHGIKPPTSMSDLASQAIAPIQNKFNAASNAFNQASQGDIAGAYKTYKSGASTTQPQAESQDVGYDHIW